MSNDDRPTYNDLLESWRRLDVTHREAQAEIAEATDRIVELESVLMGHSGRCPYTKNACERRKGEVERLSKLVDALTNALRDAVGTETTLQILRLPLGLKFVVPTEDES